MKSLPYHPIRRRFVVEIGSPEDVQVPDVFRVVETYVSFLEDFPVVARSFVEVLERLRWYRSLASSFERSDVAIPLSDVVGRARGVPA